MSVCVNTDEIERRRMHVTYSGSRRGVTEAQKEFTVSITHRLRELGRVFGHHGDCVGYDQFCDEMMKVSIAAALVPIVHPPRSPRFRAWCEPSASQRARGAELLAPDDYLARDEAMVAASAVLIAAPDSPERPKSGTWYTINRAREAEIPIWIVFPDGSLRAEPGLHISASDLTSSRAVFDIGATRSVRGGS